MVNMLHEQLSFITLLVIPVAPPIWAAYLRHVNSRNQDSRSVIQTLVEGGGGVTEHFRAKTLRHKPTTWPAHQNHHVVISLSTESTRISIFTYFPYFITSYKPSVGSRFFPLPLRVAEVRN